MKKIDLACIVDDDMIHQILLKKHLDNTGLVDHYLVFNNGKEVYQDLESRIKENRELPRVIFLDLQMPVWDGWQFLEEFGKLNIEEKIEIFIVTSSIFEKDYKRAQTYNLDKNYLIKPINTEKLKACLEKLMEKSAE
jgi:CheY-like chemotaxis protein